jgi:tetratricopeptide (TPR) repeat protein
LAVVFALACLVPRHAAIADPVADAEALFDAGMEQQLAAKKAKTPAEATVSLQQAIDKYTAAAALKSDYYRAQTMWAHCLFTLGKTNSDAAKQRDLFQQAQQRFAVAAQCTGAEWPVYYEWGTLLAFETENLDPDPAQRHALLVQAREVYGKALALASFSGDRARIERDLGLCVLRLGQDSANPGEQRSLYQEAVRRFESATKVAAQANTARIDGLWGTALLRLAKLDNDHLMIRNAIERLETCLEKDPNNFEAQYNLACAYGLLDQPEPAMRHLRVCLDHDPEHAYYNAAAQDPDLNPLRRTREFNQIFKESAPASSIPIVPPKLSDQ